MSDRTIETNARCRYAVFQEGMKVAEVDCAGDRDARREITHYAHQYHKGNHTFDKPGRIC